MSKPKTSLKIAISNGPKCPHCAQEGFDDWQHEPSLKAASGAIYGRLRCHGCGKFFSITRYADGETHSSARSSRA